MFKKLLTLSFLLSFMNGILGEEIVPVEDQAATTLVNTSKAEIIAVKPINFEITIAPKAQEFFNTLSDVAQAELAASIVELKNELMNLPELTQFVSQHAELLAKHQAWRGEVSTITLTFLMTDEDERTACQLIHDTRQHEVNFFPTLSAEDQLKFEDYGKSYDQLMKDIAEAVLSKLQTKQIASEIVQSEKADDLMIVARL